MVWRQELAHQIAVGAVNLHTGKTSLLRDAGRGGEAFNQVFDLRFGEGNGRVEKAFEPGSQGNGGRCHRLLRHLHRRLLAGMVQLHPQLGAVGGAGFRPGLQLGQIALVFQRHVAGFPQRTAVDHHVAGDHQAGAAPRPGAVQICQRRCHPVVEGAEGFAHGGFGEAVLDDGAVGKGKRLGEQVGWFHRGRLRFDRAWELR